MKVALLADIHGNLTALEEVVKDCKVKKIDKFILLGDLLLKGTNPTGVMNVVKKLDIIDQIRGNTDKWLIESNLTLRQYKMAQYVFKNIDMDIRKYFDDMKDSKVIDINNHKIYLTHDYSNEPLDKDIKLILTAHTHKPKTSGLVFNPGSVGNPYDKDTRASYGIIDIDKVIKCSIVKVDYDIEKEKYLAVKNKIPFLEKYIYTLENAVKNKYN